MSVHVGHIHFWEIQPSHIQRWLEKHLITAASAGVLLAVVAFAIATKDRDRDPVQFLDAVDEITTCKATLIHRTMHENDLMSLVSERIVFDRYKGTVARLCHWRSSVACGACCSG